MTRLSNIYLDGYIATPIIEACRARRLFDTMDRSRFVQRDWLTRELGASPGYFAVALQMLESLGWLERSRDAYRLTEQDYSGAFTQDLTPFYGVDAQTLIAEGPLAVRFVEQLSDAFAGAPRGAARGGRLMEGALAVHLFSALSEPSAGALRDRIDRLPVSLRSGVTQILIEQQWVTDD